MIMDGITSTQTDTDTARFGSGKITCLYSSTMKDAWIMKGKKVKYCPYCYKHFGELVEIHDDAITWEDTALHVLLGLVLGAIICGAAISLYTDLGY